MNGVTNPAKYSNQVENFFMNCVAPDVYKESVEKTNAANQPPKKKIYRNLNKMLQECYLIGSLKYGNNFIV